MLIAFHARLLFALLVVQSLLVSSCPLGYDDEDTWQCALGIGEDGQPIWDEACLKALEEGGSVDTTTGGGVSKCDEFWGAEDDTGNVIEGIWDKLTGTAGQEYWQCYGEGKYNLSLRLPDGAMEHMPESQWHDERFKMDKQCVSDALCAVEQSPYGWCSEYYEREIMPSCGPDLYRERFCSHLCPSSFRKAEQDPSSKKADQVFFEYHLPFNAHWKHEFNTQLTQRLKEEGITMNQFRADLLVVRDVQGMVIPRSGDLDEHRFPLHVQFGITTAKAQLDDANPDASGSEDVNECDGQNHSSSSSSPLYGLGWGAAYKGKCPVKKAGFAVADEVTEVSTKVMSWVKSALPALLASP